MAATWTKADVIAVAGELASASDPDFDFSIAMADAMIGSTDFGTLQKYAGSLLTAHLMIRFGKGSNSSGAAGAGAAVGAISSMSVGQVSIGFAQGGGNLNEAGAAEFGTTRQGSLFWELVLMVITPAMLADSDPPTPYGVL